MENRNQVFQRLKPRCVALSQTALALNGAHGNVQSVTNDLSLLNDVLCEVTVPPDSLDEKLADYVFFPLSQVLKVSSKISLRCLELSFQCLSILINQGWRSRLQPQLAGQIMILCTLMADKKPTGLAVTATTSELQERALQCLLALFSNLKTNSASRQALLSESNFPQLGQTISTVLEAVEEGESVDLQLTAVTTLQVLLRDFATPKLHASFLPGIVSKLTKVLTLQTKRRRQPKVLVVSLQILTSLLLSVLADSKTTGTKDKQQSHQESDALASIVDKAWLEKAAIQLKPALSTIMRLRSHSREDVKEELAHLCQVLLQDCRNNLADCTPFALDTLVTLSSDSLGNSITAQLEYLARNDSAFVTQLQNTVYQRLQSLPTLMQSSDTLLKTQGLQQLITAYSTLVESGTNVAMLDRILAQTLSESVVITLLPTRSSESELGITSPIQSLDLVATEGQQGGQMEFSSALVRHRGQEEILDKVAQLTKLASVATSDPIFCTDLLRGLHQSQGDMQIATFWLLLNATQESIQRDTTVDQYIDLETSQPLATMECLEDIYSFALDSLTNSSDGTVDMRLRSLSLRALALRAQVAKVDFRYELIDALYPVLHSLATPNEALQHDSIVTLNVFTSACGYGSVKELIVENVDYLTNAVALKLNAFDVSPQAPQVLLMMVRLAGPALLPYLEDTIESIFAALEDYHGYPLLVELLFRVLSVVAEEGTKTSQLATTNPAGLELLQDHRAESHFTSISVLTSLLQERAEEDSRSKEQDLALEQSHPREPWKVAADTNSDPDGSDNGEESLHSMEEQDQQVDEPEAPPPAPKTFNILLKITELTQHFLPSASPSLRSSLLALIRLSTPAIAKHENAFLPLVNTLWPEVVSRLDDAEPQVLAGALEVISTLCQYAGDFMRSRILQLWPHLLENYWKHVAGLTLTPTRSSDLTPREKSFRPQKPAALVLGNTSMISPRYSDASSRAVQESYTNAIAAIVRYVDTSPEIFDEALHVLQPYLGDVHVSSALEGENADAVWLLRLRSGAVPLPTMPNAAISRDWNFASVSG